MNTIPNPATVFGRQRTINPESPVTPVDTEEFREAKLAEEKLRAELEEQNKERRKSDLLRIDSMIGEINAFHRMINLPEIDDFSDYLYGRFDKLQSELEDTLDDFGRARVDIVNDMMIDFDKSREVVRGLKKEVDSFLAEYQSWRKDEQARAGQPVSDNALAALAAKFARK